VSREPLSIDPTSPPFDQYTHIAWLGSKRRGRDSQVHARHQLFTARARHTPLDVLVKVTTKPGLVYERELDNEWRTLATINRERPTSACFPWVYDNGYLADGRRYLITSLFDEFPLATIVGTAHEASTLVRSIRIAIEIARALGEIHALGIFHVDLNPMNVLYRTGVDRPVIRIVDFESAYETGRHGAGESYSPPTTAGFSAPEAARETPTARVDVFSLGAVLYTLLAGYRWTSGAAVWTLVAADDVLDAELRQVLLVAVDPDARGRYPAIDAFEAALGGYLEMIWRGRRW
jgi:serine/threonine protein kinase